jgi:hypothetical protein
VDSQAFAVLSKTNAVWLSVCKALGLSPSARTPIQREIGGAVAAGFATPDPEDAWEELSGGQYPRVAKRL